MLHDATLAIDSGGTIEADYFANGTSSMNVQVCFPAGTPVVMADGTTRTIENILSGDEVKAVAHQNPNGEIVTGRVVRIFRNAPQMLCHLHFGTFEIRATKEHPFYVQGKGWIAAEDLKVGDVCRSASGNDVVLLYIDYESEEVPVFNFEVEGWHTYFVGNDVTKSVLVHNECPIHSYTVFPDCIDKYLNASRNGINYYLFGMPIKTTCTCGQITKSQTGRVENYSLASLAANSPGGASSQNKIDMTEQVIDYTNRVADLLQEVQMQLAMLPFGTVFSIGDDVVRGASTVIKTKPLQLHHFGTIYGDNAKRLERIIGKYGLDLRGAWNKELLPHQGRHTQKYHDAVYRLVEQADREAGNDVNKFLELYEKYVKKWVRENPGVMYIEQ